MAMVSGFKRKQMVTMWTNINFVDTYKLTLTWDYMYGLGEGKLHCLPIWARRDFKILLITYKALNNQAPDYISEILTKYKPMCKLRSADKNLLIVPGTNSKHYGDRAFSAVAPKLWNVLPLNIRNCPSVKNGA